MRACLCLALAGLSLLTSTPAYAEDIRVLSSVAMKSVVEALTPEFARTRSRARSSRHGRSRTYRPEPAAFCS